jgi:hypothetical protein
MQEKIHPSVSITTSTAPTLITAGNMDSINAWIASISGQYYGNGAYQVTTSSSYFAGSILVHPAWNLFQRTFANDHAHWSWDHYVNGGFDTNRFATPSYSLDGGSYYGDWVTIQMPTPIILTKCTFKPRSGLLARLPGIFRIYGSNDGINWDLLHDQTAVLPYSDEGMTVQISGLPTYSHLGLVVSALAGSDAALNFARWDIYGKVCTILSAILRDRIRPPCVFHFVHLANMAFGFIQINSP